MFEKQMNLMEKINKMIDHIEKSLVLHTKTYIQEINHKHFILKKFLIHPRKTFHIYG